MILKNAEDEIKLCIGKEDMLERPELTKLPGDSTVLARQYWFRLTLRPRMPVSPEQSGPSVSEIRFSQPFQGSCG